MTIGTNLMPRGSGLLLDAMTSAASGGLLPGMGLVTADAARVAGFDQACFTLVAMVAPDFVWLGQVGKPLVAARTCLMSRIE